MKTSQAEMKRSSAIPSLVKWTGSKRSQARQIFQLLPPYERYFEPFVGGGALLYMAARPGSVAGDIYKPLINLWRLVQKCPEVVIDNYRLQFSHLNRELDGLDLTSLPALTRLPTYYYEVRDRFNATGDPLDLNFILRTCVNGIVRFNSKGEFNNSFHLTRRGMDPARFQKVVLAWHQILRDVEFICQDYKATLEHAKKGDFVYLDPPYAGNRQRYIGDLDLRQFFSQLEKLNHKGVMWALSFDGSRGSKSLVHDVPKSLYTRHIFLSSGNSAVNKVLNGPLESVEESLYLNY